jgi:hypothetical protein
MDVQYIANPSNLGHPSPTKEEMGTWLCTNNFNSFSQSHFQSLSQVSYISSLVSMEDEQKGKATEDSSFLDFDYSSSFSFISSSLSQSHFSSQSVQFEDYGGNIQLLDKGIKDGLLEEEEWETLQALNQGFDIRQQAEMCEKWRKGGLLCFTKYKPVAKKV